MKEPFPPSLQTPVTTFGLPLAPHPSDTSYKAFSANLGHLCNHELIRIPQPAFLPTPTWCGTISIEPTDPRLRLDNNMLGIPRYHDHICICSDLCEVMDYTQSHLG